MYTVFGRRQRDGRWSDRGGDERWTVVLVSAVCFVTCFGLWTCPLFFPSLKKCELDLLLYLIIQSSFPKEEPFEYPFYVINSLIW